MLKLKMMLCVMMLPLVVVGCTSKQSVSQCVKPPPPPAWIMQPPRLADTAERIIGHPQREADHQLCKNNWKEPRSMMISSVDRVAHIDGQLMYYCEQYTRALQRSINAKVIKPSNPFTNVCWVSVLTTFFVPPQILAASTVSSAQFQKREMMAWFWCYCCRFVLNSKRSLSTSCNKQGQRSSEQHFFHGVIPDAF